MGYSFFVVQNNVHRIKTSSKCLFDFWKQTRCLWYTGRLPWSVFVLADVLVRSPQQVFKFTTGFKLPYKVINFEIKLTDASSLSPHNGPILYRFQTSKRFAIFKATWLRNSWVIQKLHQKYLSFASTDTCSLSRCYSVSCLESAFKNAFVWMLTDGTVLAFGGPLLFQVCKWESIMKQWISKLFQFWCDQIHWYCDHTQINQFRDICIQWMSKFI